MFSKPLKKQNAGISAQRTPSAGRNAYQSVLTLQRAAGNRATAQLLASRQVVQREMSEENKIKVKEDLRAFYTSRKQAKTNYDALFVHDATALVTKYGKDGVTVTKDELRAYYKDLLKNEFEPTVVTAPVNNGVLTIAAIQQSPFTGNTGGQSYINNNSTFKGYENHLSVSHNKMDAIKRTATITGLHMSFKDGHKEIRFWYNVSSGVISYSSGTNPSGAGGVSQQTLSDMKTKADSFIRSKLGVLKCTYP